MRKLLAFVAALVLVGEQAAAHAAHNKRPELIEAMNKNGCRITPASVGETLTRLEIDTKTALEFFGKMIDEGIAAFADDDETLLLLPPACKS